MKIYICNYKTNSKNSYTIRLGYGTFEATVLVSNISLANGNSSNQSIYKSCLFELK